MCKKEAGAEKAFQRTRPPQSTEIPALPSSAQSFYRCEMRKIGVCAEKALPRTRPPRDPRTTRPLRALHNHSAGAKCAMVGERIISASRADLLFFIAREMASRCIKFLNVGNLRQ